jgi:hypothetical protein
MVGGTKTRFLSGGTAAFQAGLAVERGEKIASLTKEEE